MNQTVQNMNQTIQQKGTKFNEAASKIGDAIGNKAEAVFGFLTEPMEPIWKEVKEANNDCTGINDMTSDQVDELGWSCIKENSIPTMKGATLVLGLLLIANIVIGLVLVIMMIVDTVKNSSKAYSLNKDDPGYKTVIGIGSTASRFSFLNVANYFKGYPFILLQVISGVIIIFSGVMFMRVLALQGAMKAKLFYGLIFLYCVISGLINITYSASKMNIAKREEFGKYQEFNESVRDYMYRDANFISALSSPSSTNRNDNIIAALRAVGSDPVDTERLSNIFVTLAMYTYFDDLNDENDRVKALQKLFDPFKFTQSILPDINDPTKYMNEPLEYTMYLYRKRIAIDDAMLQGYITAAQSASTPVPVIANSNECVLRQARTLAIEKINRLNNTYLSFFPQAVFLTMRMAATAIFMAQLAIPVICYMLWRRYGNSIAPQ